MKSIKIYYYQDLVSQSVSKLIDAYTVVGECSSGTIEVKLPNINKIKSHFRETLKDYDALKKGISKTIIVNTCIPASNTAITEVDAEGINSPVYELKFKINNQYVLDESLLNSAIEEVFNIYLKYDATAKAEFKINNVRFIQLPGYDANTVVAGLLDEVVSRSLTEVCDFRTDDILYDSNLEFTEYMSDVEISDTDIKLLEKLTY